jgi:hypothetical protein
MLVHYIGTAHTVSAVVIIRRYYRCGYIHTRIRRLAQMGTYSSCMFIGYIHYILTNFNLSYKLPWKEGAMAQ